MQIIFNHKYKNRNLFSYIPLNLFNLINIKFINLFIYLFKSFNFPLSFFLIIQNVNLLIQLYFDYFFLIFLLFKTKIMEEEGYKTKKIQLKQKGAATLKERDYKDLKKGEKEKEISEAFYFFGDKLIEIMITPQQIFEEYKSSEYLKILKNSDAIRKIMKKSLVDLEKEELESLLENIRQNIIDYKFDEEIESMIQSESKNNLLLFIDEFKSTKKANALRIIGEMKSDFENNFNFEKLHVIEFEKKISELMADFCFEKEHIKKINDIINQIMKQNYIELINNEIKYF